MRRIRVGSEPQERRTRQGGDEKCIHLNSFELCAEFNPQYLVAIDGGIGWLELHGSQVQTLQRLRQDATEILGKLVVLASDDASRRLAFVLPVRVVLFRDRFLRGPDMY